MMATAFTLGSVLSHPAKRKPRPAPPATAATPPLETVRHVDLNRYTGRWFEIARYPNWFERKCDRDVTADYSIKETGDIRVVNACITRTGKIERSEGTAKVVDASTNAKLKVTFFWPFYGNYWIRGLYTKGDGLCRRK
jgi:apolipoprotein D and lipocalin family protein